MIIYLGKHLYQRVIEQAKLEFPLECCGLLAGFYQDNGIYVKQVFSMKNIDESSEHFSMDPQEQFAAIKQIREAGWELLGNYHSHPYTPSRPSDEDKRLAYNPDWIYGILSLADKAHPVFNFFTLNPSKSVGKHEIKLQD